MREIWVSTDDRGHRETWAIEFSPGGLTTIAREDLAELLTKAGLRFDPENSDPPVAQG